MVTSQPIFCLFACKSEPSIHAQLSVLFSLRNIARSWRRYIIVPRTQQNQSLGLHDIPAPVTWHESQAPSSTYQSGIQKQVNHNLQVLVRIQHTDSKIINTSAVLITHRTSVASYITVINIPLSGQTCSLICRLMICPACSIDQIERHKLLSVNGMEQHKKHVERAVIFGESCYFW